MTNLQPIISNTELETPVLFLIFNRLKTTKLVFEQIRLAKPLRLYIAADGAREKKEGEIEKVKIVREYVLSHIDWTCKVLTLFHEKNLGCKYAVSSAINWFFKNEEMGIILEDDCLPNQSFFKFSEVLLEKYKNNEKIWLITGSNINEKYKDSEFDYVFSKYGSIWGWASWRRAWMNYNVDMPEFKAYEKHNKFIELYNDKSEMRNEIDNFRKTFEGKIDTWDYQWLFYRRINNALSIVPSRNMIKNIGFGIEATHTMGNYINDHYELYDYIFPLKYNDNIAADHIFDNYFHNENINILSRIILYVKKITNIIAKIISRQINNQ